jgi:glycosyltransferase involved in cell wall biosynthesis
MTTQEGLHMVARYGLTPEVIFFDADHSYESLMADLNLAHELFPHARLIGDDYSSKPVGEAVGVFCRRRGLEAHPFGMAWRAWRMAAPVATIAPGPGGTGPAALSAADNPRRQATARTIRISLCMIVRDNERTIRACLESILPWVDEMIVVDTGSQDRTPEICRELGAKVIHFPWPDSFSGARNESLRHARGEWIFWMDSDDTIPAECGRRLRELALGRHDPDVWGYIMQVHCPGAGPDGEHDVVVVDHLKLFRNRPELQFEFRIHEQVLGSLRRAGGQVARTDLYVVHSGADHTPQGKQQKLARDLRLLRMDLAERPDHSFVLYNLGMTYSDAAQYEQAVQYLARAIEVADPGESQVRKAHALLVLSYFQLGRFGDAFDACRRGLASYSKDPELRFREGLLHHHFGRLKEAEVSYLAALAKDDEEHLSSIHRGIMGFKAKHNLAVVYADMGAHDRAEVQWRQIVHEEPNYADGWRGLIDNLILQGKLDDAKHVARDLLDHRDLRRVALVAFALSVGTYNQPVIGR